MDKSESTLDTILSKKRGRKSIYEDKKESSRRRSEKYRVRKRNYMGELEAEIKVLKDKNLQLTNQLEYYKRQLNISNINIEADPSMHKFIEDEQFFYEKIPKMVDEKSCLMKGSMQVNL